MPNFIAVPTPTRYGQQSAHRQGDNLDTKIKLSLNVPESLHSFENNLNSG